MQVFLPAPRFLFPSEEHATTSKSGAIQTFGKCCHSTICYAKLSDSRPRNADELFNLRHASARNVIEQIFGVLKWCFRILVHPLQIDIDMQACLPPALAALHNFIQMHDPDDIADFDSVEDSQPGTCVEGSEGELCYALCRVQSIDLFFVQQRRSVSKSSL